MSTPSVREDEILMPARPRAGCVTSARKMAKQRYHYVAGALMVWRPTGEGRREPVRLIVHTMCRNWVTLPSLVDIGEVSGKICDLCMLHQSREWDARKAPGTVDF